MPPPPPPQRAHDAEYQQAYAQHGYYMPDGTWVPYSAHDYQQQQQWRPGGGEPVAAGEVGKGRGFTAKMGDRAIVRKKFTTEQRAAREGKGGGLADDDDGDVYGADVLLGAGGLVRSASYLCMQRVLRADNQTPGPALRTPPGIRPLRVDKCHSAVPG